MSFLSVRTRSMAAMTATLLIIAGCVTLAVRSSDEQRTTSVLTPTRVMERRKVSITPSVESVDVIADHLLMSAERDRLAWLASLPAPAVEPEPVVPAGRDLPAPYQAPYVAPAPSWPTSLYPCGGDLPPCSVKNTESGGNYGAVNPTGCGGRSCGGAWQFDPLTWNGYGGYARAELAPPEVQDAKARELWAGGAGCRHWAACG